MYIGKLPQCRKMPWSIQHSLLCRLPIHSRESKHTDSRSCLPQKARCSVGPINSILLLFGFCYDSSYYDTIGFPAESTKHAISSFTFFSRCQSSIPWTACTRLLNYINIIHFKSCFHILHRQLCFVPYNTGNKGQ